MTRIYLYRLSKNERKRLAEKALDKLAALSDEEFWKRFGDCGPVGVLCREENMRYHAQSILSRIIYHKIYPYDDANRLHFNRSFTRSVPFFN